MKKSYFFLFAGGLILGMVLAFGLLKFRQSDRAIPARNRSEAQGITLQIPQDATVSQGGNIVGRLTQNTRLWQSADNETQEQMHLLLEWEKDGNFQTHFLPAADDEIPDGGRAFVSLESER